VVWAIGDIQGCYRPLRELLQKIDFDPTRDQLWLAGDLVNRGEGSLETLEYLYSIRKSLVVVLGNHDIALIAAYLMIKKSNPSIDPIMHSPHAKKLIQWLRMQKFLHTDKDLGYCMSHAGISPQFNLKMAQKAAKKLEKSLQSEQYGGWLASMFGQEIDHYDEKMSDIEKQRYSLASFIRMRFCYDDGRLEFRQKGAPDSRLIEQRGLKPWFASPARKKIALKILFGHWSTLGLYNDSEVCCLDTGCVWNGVLTAMRLDSGDEEIVQVACSREKE